MGANFGYLSNLFMQMEQESAYNEILEMINKGETVSNSLFSLADVNNDGVVDSDDIFTIRNKISELSSSKKLFDINKDGTVSYFDLAKLLNNQDLDGDGKSSDAEKTFLLKQADVLSSKLTSDLSNSETVVNINAFILFLKNKSTLTTEEQDKLQEYQKLLMNKILGNTNLDLTNDGKTDNQDYQKFLALSKGQLDNPSSEIKDFVNSYKTKMANSVFDFDNDGNANINDLKLLGKNIINANKYIENNIFDISKDELIKLDANLDGKFDKNDVDILENSLASLMEYLGQTDGNNDGKLTVDDISDLLKDPKTKPEVIDNYSTAKSTTYTNTAAEMARQKALNAAGIDSKGEPIKKVDVSNYKTTLHSTYTNTTAEMARQQALSTAGIKKLPFK